MALHAAIKGKLISVIGDEVSALLCTLSYIVVHLRTLVLDSYWAELVKLTKIVTLIFWWSIKVFSVRLHSTDGNDCIVGTAVSEVEECFKRFMKRDDIDIILINQNIAEMIRHVIDGHTSPIPAVLEIPSKDHPYDASKDSILRRAKVGGCNLSIIMQLWNF